jgi:predicted SAM-dependent methyltransferase
MTKIFCPICGSGSIFDYSKNDPYLKGCHDCKIVFTHPLPEGLTEAYDEDYYKIWYEKQLKQRVRATKNLHDLDIHLTEIENADFEENSFDVITLWHVIEHVKNPLEVLKKVYSLSKPGAVVFVATPSLDKHVSRIIYRLKSNKPYPFYSPKGEQHLFHFTEYTLERIIKKAGFNIIYTGVDFASVRLEFKMLEYASFILSTIIHRNWNENILVIAQK